MDPQALLRSIQAAQSGQRAGRRIAAGGFVLVAAALALSWANSSRYYLHCSEGVLEARRGRFLPWGTEALPEFSPLRGGSCESEELSSRAALEQRFTDIALSRVDAALAAQDPESIDAAMTTLQDLARLGATAREQQEFARRKVSLVLARLRLDARKAKDMLLRVQQGLQAARQLGIDPAALLEIERSLQLQELPVEEAPAGKAEPTPTAKDEQQPTRTPVSSGTETGENERSL